jgi:hypothetical protein
MDPADVAPEITGFGDDAQQWRVLFFIRVTLASDVSRWIEMRDTSLP